MQPLIKFYAPGPDEIPGAQGDTSDEEREKSEKVNEEKEHSKSKSGSKLKDALQQWSNDDERDRAIDDSSPLRSGL